MNHGSSDRLAGLPQNLFSDEAAQRVLLKLVSPCKQIIEHYLVGWSAVFGFVDLQHVCCELRKWEDEGFKLLRSKAPDVQDYKALVESFSEAHGLSAPGSRSCRRQAPNYIGSPEEALFLDFFTALVVRFRRLWIPQTKAIRPGAQKFLQASQWPTKKIGQFSHLFNRRTLQQWQDPCQCVQQFFLGVLCYTCKHSGLFKLPRTQIQVYNQAVPSGRVWRWPTTCNRSPVFHRDSRDLVLSVLANVTLFASEDPIWLQCTNVATNLQAKVDSVPNLKFLYPRALKALKPPELEALAFTVEQD